MGNKETEFRVEQVEALARGLAPHVLEDALKRTVERLAGVPREALEGVLRGNESDAVTRAPVLDAARLKTLPDETLEALATVFFEVAIETTPDLPEPAPPAAPVSGDATAAFTGSQVWKPEASDANSFRGFYEQNGALSRDAFLARHKAPFLVSAVTFDKATWSGAIVLPVEKKPGPDMGGAIAVGRDESCDLVIPHTSVSKRHFTLALDGGRWTLTDVGSANGTRIDDVKIDANKPVKLRDISKLDLGGAHVTFNTPAGLFHFIEQVRKLAGHKTEANARAQAPLGKIVLRPGPPQKPAAATAPPPKRSSDRSPKATSSHKLPALPAETETRAEQALRGVASLVGTPQRLAATVIMTVVLGGALLVIAKPLAMMLFMESHPEWFESDLPARLKNPK